MSRKTYDFYRSKCFVLAKTMVVKHYEAAVIVNNRLESSGYQVNWLDPTTWKYYLNMCGEYHISDMDLLKKINGDNSPYMRIKVAGPNGPLPADFTKDLLHGTNADSATANEYAYGSVHYKNLVNTYPKFETLILGILNPVDMDIAVNAPNNTILICGEYYAEPNDSEYQSFKYVKTDDTIAMEDLLIQPQEWNLIPRLQTLINNFLFRWNTPDYALTDNLYVPTLLGVLYAYMEAMIETIRLDNCLTEKAHTYHIREYLDGFGGLGQYVPVLPIAVSMYLYRNAVYHTANSGKSGTFKELIDNVMTPSRVPLYGYHLVHDVSDMPSSLYADPVMKRETLNIQQLGSGASVRSIENILTRELELARDNGYDFENTVDSISKKSSRSNNSDVRTKVLESTMIDYSGVIRYPLADMLLNMWLYSATSGTYNGTIYVQHPINATKIMLTPLNAYILMIYCMNKGYSNLALDNVPTLEARLIPRLQYPTPGPDFTPPPTLQELKNLVDVTRLPDATINKLYPTTQIDNFNFSSPKSFYTKVKYMHTELMRKWYEVVREEDLYNRAYMEYLLTQFYWYDVPCVLSPSGETYDAWIDRQGIDLTGMDRDNFVSLALEIVKKATGADADTSQKLKDLQTAVLSVMKHFSSYTVQYLSGIVYGSPIVSEGKTVRLTNGTFRGYIDNKLELPKVTMSGNLSGQVKIEAPFVDTSDDPTPIKASGQVRIVLELPSIQVNAFTLTINGILPIQKLNNEEVIVN